MYTDTTQIKIHAEGVRPTACNADSLTAPNKAETGKSLSIIAAQFTMRGYALLHTVRANDGRVTFSISRWAEFHTFTPWTDALALMVQIGGAT